MNLVECKDLTKRFGATVALDKVNIEIFEKSIHLILGPNGSGKSTLLKIILGLYRPTSGIVKVFGLNPWKYSYEVHKKCSAVIEGLPLLGWISGRDFLKTYCKLKGISWEYMDELASTLRIKDYWNKHIRTYSSGMRKRILLAMGLLSSSELIILDEPFTLIDNTTLNEIIDIIYRLNSDKGATFIIASHMLPSKLKEIANSLTILFNGKVLIHKHLGNISELKDINIPIRVHIKTKNINEDIELISKNIGISKIVINKDRNTIELLTTVEKIPILKNYFKTRISFKIDFEELYRNLL